MIFIAKNIPNQLDLKRIIAIKLIIEINKESVICVKSNP